MGAVRGGGEGGRLAAWGGKRNCCIEVWTALSVDSEVWTVLSVDQRCGLPYVWIRGVDCPLAFILPSPCKRLAPPPLAVESAMAVIIDLYPPLKLECVIIVLYVPLPPCSRVGHERDYRPVRAALIASGPGAGGHGSQGRQGV